ncbi:hypothetical protein Y032_0018g3540 [Ancylostoma ceylanicum]|uniref:Uncharacterized protein n=1 Tax=Ancylostoma ceylanicum TaxID=53326 RepID=A0A016V293_9BILA|nr:hypothetical protein Y032_0018g3540 [Ancylostoma ceylanicum]
MTRSYEFEKLQWKLTIITAVNSKRPQTSGGIAEQRSCAETRGLCMLALVVCFCRQQRTGLPRCSRQPEPACRALASLPKNAAPRSRPLSTTVWSSLYVYGRNISYVMRYYAIPKKS